MLDLAKSVDTSEVMTQSGDNSRGRDRTVGGGTDFAGIVREGGEAEARRAVVSKKECKLQLIGQLSLGLSGEGSG